MKLLILRLQLLLRLPKFQVRAHARQQDFHLERLGDVIHRADFQPLHFIHKVGERRHENDWNVAGQWVRFQLAARLEAVHVRHHHIEQNHVRLRLRNRLKRALPVDADQHFELHGIQIIEEHS